MGGLELMGNIDTGLSVAQEDEEGFDESTQIRNCQYTPPPSVPFPFPGATSPLQLYRMQGCANRADPIGHQPIPIRI